jgi:3-hydroxyisobutyrate dehydrogenase
MTKAFLGLGLLGSNFVRAMRKRGEEVNVWNRTPSRTAALEETGAKTFTTAAEAVKGAQLVHICVSDDEAVDSILEQAAPGFEKNVIIVDHTTTSATLTIERVAKWKSKGVSYIHAPVFMGPMNALESTGMMMVSGDQTIVKQIEPELAKMTGGLDNIGEDPGIAAAYKLLGNHNFLAISAGLVDTFTLGKSLGLSIEDITDFIEQMGSAPMKARVARLMMKNYDTPTWELLMARKDARIMQEEAERVNTPLMVMPALGKVMDRFIADGDGGKDWTIFSKKAVE